jgi:hypothetical protein
MGREGVSSLDLDAHQGMAMDDPYLQEAEFADILSLVNV